MSISRPTLRATLLAVAVVAVSACSNAAPPAGGGSTPAGATANPATQPTVGAPVPGGNNPPILAAAFTTGKWHVEISGDLSATLDAPLQGGVSSAGSTVLSYADPTSGEGGGIVISDQGNAITFTSPRISTAGSNASAAGVGCTISVSQSDASRLAGTFDCKRLPALFNNSTTQGTVDLRGTFEASR